MKISRKVTLAFVLSFYFRGSHGQPEVAINHEIVDLRQSSGASRKILVLTKK